MDPETALALTVAGASGGSGRLSSSLDHLGLSLQLLLRELSALTKKSAEERALYGPFLARSVLELACYSMIARVDPFRVLLVIGVQESSDYDIEKAYQSSIHWSGDVVAKDRGKAMLWSETSKPADMSRSLFGDYAEALIWKEAFEAVDPCLFRGLAYEPLASIQGNGFVPAIRARVSRLYSAFSKGVHHESFIPARSIFDASTLTTSITELLHVLCQCALVLNHCEWIHRRPAPDQFQEATSVLCDYEVRFV